MDYTLTGTILIKKYKAACLMSLIMLVVFIASCQKDTYRDIDYSNTIDIKQLRPLSKIDDSSLTFAVASIVSASESFAGFQALAGYLQERSGRRISVVHPKTYQEILDLFGQGTVDIGSICSGPYIIGNRAQLFVLLVSPVIKGKTYYQAYVIVPANSAAKSVSDLSGKPFVFSDRLSLTGYFFPLFLVRDTSGTAWRESIFSGSQDQSISLVNRGIVAGGSVSGLVYDDIASRFPEQVRNTRILERSAEFGMPPIVVSTAMPILLRDSLREAFLEMALTSGGRAVLRSLGIDKYEEPHKERYDGIEKMVPKILSR
jgi:phosphonate transport system substrate-binding protein